MTHRFVGPIRRGAVPAQPMWMASWCLDWNSFDVPRIWTMVEHEGNRAAWDQVGGFRFLADFLEDQYRVWRAQRDRIAEAWQSPAGVTFLNVVDMYGADLLSDAACARQTASAWDRTVSVLDSARTQIEPLKKQWDRVTSDYLPLSWEDRANQLNRESRQIMLETDKAVADARPYIAQPNPFEPWFDPGPLKPTDDSGMGPAFGTGFLLGAEASGSRPHVPPVPGFEPMVGVQTAPELATTGGEVQLPLGAPRMVTPVPGTPVSMLPIPPGNMYAPFGGAYILPGPGVGRGGYVVPMPRTPGTGAVGGPRALLPPSAGGAVGAAGAGGGVTGGMMPVPMAGGPGGSGGHGSLYRRPNVAWQVDKGVPPVIKIEQDDYVPDQPSPKQEEEFRDWFTDLAYPWRAEFKSSEGAHVTVRTVPQ